MVLILNMDRILSSEEAIDMERLRKVAFESAELPEPPKKSSNPDEDARELAEFMLRGEEPALGEMPEPAADWIDEATSIDENSQIVNREKAAEELAKSFIEPDEPAVVAGAEQPTEAADQGADGEGTMSVSRALAKRKKKTKKTKKAKKAKKTGTSRKSGKS